MAIHWKVEFRSLRSNTLYTVNIYDSSYDSSPVYLKGAAQPFITEESTDEDMFVPVRTQSGYIRIVDDGKDVNGNTLSSSDTISKLLPTTDTARPVTLTHTESGNTIYDWQGFIQAQNFGRTLYGNPQEIEIPVQCALSVIESTDMSTANHSIQNFAYLLKLVKDDIKTKSGNVISFDYVMVQGGAHAREWLLKRLDWQNFVTTDDDGQPTARFNLSQILTELCRFWGWTARTYSRYLYLVMADDAATEPNFLSLTPSQLDDLAGGDTGVGNTTGTFGTITPSSSPYASIDNNDFMQRGPNKVEVSVSPNQQQVVIDPFTDELEEEMMGTPFADKYYVGNVQYTEDVNAVSTPYLDGLCWQDRGSFNIIAHNVGDGHYEKIGNAISIKKTFASSGNVFCVKFETYYEHSFADGFFQLLGTIYQDGNRFDTTEGRWFAGDAYMQMKLGIGTSRATAMWWDGRAWGSTETVFKATIGNKDEEIFTRYWPYPTATAKDSNMIPTTGASSVLSGIVFLEFHGTDSSLVPEINGERRFDIKDFQIVFHKNNTVAKQGPYPNSGWYDIRDLTLPKKYVYKASNSNNSRIEYAVDTVFGSENKMLPSYGVVLNINNSYMQTASYGSSTERPEQHLANRIANYWATAKRRIDVEIRVGEITYPTPQKKIRIDGAVCYPISISRNWADDIWKLINLEL